MSDYKYNQAPKAFSEQSAKWRKGYSDVDALAKTHPGRYSVMPKYDGCLAIIDTVGDRIISREGKEVTSMPHALADAKRLFPGLVLFGEAWRPGSVFKDVSGEFRRTAPQSQLCVWVFDSVTHAEWVAGYSPTPWAERFERLAPALESSCPGLRRGSSGAADNLLLTPYANALVAKGGYDGGILRDREAPWAVGKAVNGEVIKIKPTQSLDLRVVDWFPGKGKYVGSGGGIVVEYEGVRSEVGTGFTDQERGAIWQGFYTGKLVEIEVMAVNSSGKLREPRFKGVKDDKEQPDV